MLVEFPSGSRNKPKCPKQRRGKDDGLDLRLHGEVSRRDLPSFRNRDLRRALRGLRPDRLRVGARAGANHLPRGGCAGARHRASAGGAPELRGAREAEAQGRGDALGVATPPLGGARPTSFFRFWAAPYAFA